MSTSRRLQRFIRGAALHSSALLVAVGALALDLRAMPSAAMRALGQEPSLPAADEARPLSANERKREALREIHERILDSFDMYYGGRWVQRLRSELEALPADAPAETSLTLTRQLADWLLREGEIEVAIQQLSDQGRRLSETGGVSNEQVAELLKALAVAYLRQAEQANCLCERSSESCVFPLREGGRHRDRRGAELAAALLTQALVITPPDLQSAWLLNLAHMALGTHPEGVPGMHLIPPERFESEHDIGRFEDVAHCLGDTARTCAGGAVMDDFDGDGLLDVIVSSMELSTPMAYYRNRGDGTFEDLSVASGLATQVGALNFVHGDVNGDGRLDLYVPRGAWLMRNGEIPHSLLVQQEDGSFLDLTEASGVALSAPSQVAAFADIDNDGDLDLFVGCESMLTGEGWLYPSRLYRNDGHGRFEEVAREAGVQNLQYCKGAAFGDYDADGWVDLYVSNGGGPNRLYQNQGDGTFVDRALELGVAAPLESFATWWFDVNNDGSLDLLVTNYAGRDRTQQVCAYYKNGTTGLDSARLYVNDGEGGFRDATVEYGLARAFFPMGANFGDFDNDGFPDLYFGTGDPDLGSLWPNVALRNDGGVRFQDVTTSGGFGHLQKGHGVAFGDIDGDGDQDIFVQMGGAYADDAFWDVLYENPGHGNRWLTVRLEGKRSNRYAVGARIRVRIAEGESERDVYAFVGSGGSFGGNSLQAEIGLGQAERILFLEVRWPATHETERFTGVPLDSILHVVEGTGRFEVLPSRPFRLGAAPEDETSGD